MKARPVRQFRRFDGSSVEEIRYLGTDECGTDIAVWKLEAGIGVAIRVLPYRLG